MQTSKKSSKNKPQFVLLYGPIGAGKLTVALELQKLTNYKLIHNHMLLNLTEELFPRGGKTPFRSELVQKLFYMFIKEAAQRKVNLIMTHPYAYTFVYKNGITDPQFVKKMIKTSEKYGGTAHSVHLVCDEKENIKRATSASRTTHKKLIDKSILKEILEKEDHYTSAGVKNDFKLDNTNLSAKKVAQIIKKHFSL